MRRSISYPALGLLFLLCLSCNGDKVADFHKWADTPPMGWNSWDCFGPTVTEDEVKSNAAYMAEHLKEYGWEYIIVDIRWYVGNDKAHGYNQTDPDYVIDSFGRFQPAVNRFPSAANGNGFKPLADYIHGKGLKFGIHIMRGVPVIAVKNRLPVKGSSVTAADIYSEENQCTWLRDMYTVVPGKTGAQEYYNSLFELYASWGVDFVKVDDLSSPVYFDKEVEMIRKAIDRTGRPILLSTSPGETPESAATHVQQHANMWRTVGDFWDSWDDLKEHFSVFERWNKYRIAGAWPDGDMLPLGHIGIRAERGENRMSAFTREEQYTLMTLWCMFRSPLMFGGHLPDNDPFTDSLLTNEEVLYVLNRSTNNRPLFRTDRVAVWVADDPATGDKFLAIFNIADQKKIQEERAIWKSDLISRAGKQEIDIDVALKNAKQLFLVVSDGGDNSFWDHANWIDPVLESKDNKVSLLSYSWTSASSGWSRPRIDTSVSGNPLIVGNKTYAKGIGTHANSVIAYDLPRDAERFRAKAGIDKQAIDQNTGGTVRFLVFTEDPSGPVPPDQQKVSVPLNQFGFTQTCTVRDLWSRQDLGERSGRVEVEVKRHSCVLYRISKKSKD